MTEPKHYFRLVPLLLALALAGCDSIPFIDTTPDYKTAGRSRPLEVPPDLTSVSTSDTYSVPGSGTTYSQYAQGQTQQDEQTEKVLPTFDSVKMERAGSQRWLVVQAAPEKVWPVVREFWTDLGFAVRVENADSGVMETEWVDPSSLTTDDKGNYLDKFQGWLDKLNTLQSRQKFRSRIDRGAEEATTEIYLSHRSVADVHDDGIKRVRTVYGEIDNGYKLETNKNTARDEARAIAEDIDAELLRRLMVKLGVEEKTSHTVIASNASEKRATLEAGKDGYASLKVNDEFDRAWRRVGLALDRIGFLVEDKNRSRGVYYVRYSDLGADTPEQKESFLSKLKFWGDDKDEQKAAEEPKKDNKGLADKLKFWENEDPAAKELQYAVTVEPSETGSTVFVADKNAQRVRTATANRILSMLYDQLK
jgi:outer membrane protein assembly factor BamC